MKGIAKKLINRCDFASNDRGKLGEISDCLEEGLQVVPVLLEYNAADAVTVTFNTSEKPDNAWSICPSVSARCFVEAGIQEL